MKTLEIIAECSREELEAFRNEVISELHLNPDALPFSVFAALRNTENVSPISNSMFYMVLRSITGGCSYIWGPTDSWLDNESIKAWIRVSLRDSNYIFFLTQEQEQILIKVEELRATMGSGETFIREVSLVADNTLETAPLTEEEQTHPIAQWFHIPENSGSLNVAEHTSRFSGASWFEEIQKKTIILAGLGGIGSYVCFLLSRMQPTSLFIYDDDIVEGGNMSGQLYGNCDIGEYKVDAIAAMVGNYSLYHSVFAIKEKFTFECEATDIMICGFDNMEARKIFFRKWYMHVLDKPITEREHCLFIDGRLSAEYLQVYCFTGDDTEAIAKYERTALFSDAEADETVCSYKQTSYMANMIGSLIVNMFTNFVANEVAGAPIRELPFFTEYDGNSMQLKIE